MTPLLQTDVDPAWLDYNGHMNDAAYALAFSRSTDALMDAIGLDAAGRARHGQTVYTLIAMIHYLHEVHAGAHIAICGRILEHDAKRMRIWLEMRCGGTLAATSEQLLLCVRQKEDGARAASFAPEVAVRIAAMAAGDGHLPPPEAAGRGVALRRR